MRGCTAPSCRSPTASHAQVRWVAEELCAAAGLTVADGGPALTLDPAWDLRTAAATLARSEELGGAADEHGRFPAAASTLRAGAAPLDEIVLALREAATAAGVEPAPVYPGGARFAVALTHDIDTPWRWSGRGLLGAGARLKSALAARDSEAARVEVTGLARAPLHRLLGSDPNWSHDRFAASEQRHGFRSTCFVLAAHRDPHDGAAPEAYAARRARLVAELDALGLEVGLHASYTCLADERLVASERAVLAGLLGGPIAGNRHHYLRLPWHEGIRTLDRLGFSYDTTLGYAERPGPRAGLSFPFRPWDIADGGADAHPRAAARADGRDARGGALPGALARGRLGRGRAHPRSPPRRGGMREHPLAQRPLRPHLRAWLGPLYDRLLEGIAARGGHADTAGALAAHWREERCAS